MDGSCKSVIKYVGVLVLAVAMIAVLAVLAMPEAAYAEPDAKPVEIGTYEELAAFISGINDGSIDPAQDAVLTADIVVPESVGNDWVPLAKDQEHKYQGTFDGADHSITGIKIDRSKAYPDTWKAGVTVESYTAFMSFLGDQGTVASLHVEADITDVNCVAGIVSQNEGTIVKCSFKGKLTSNLYPNSGSGPSYCYPDGVFEDASAESGCIAAVNMGIIEKCSTEKGTTIYHGGIHCGGICGAQIEGGVIEGCENNADVSIDETSYPAEAIFVGGVGGIAGSQTFSYYYGEEETVEQLLLMDSASLRYLDPAQQLSRHDFDIKELRGTHLTESGGTATPGRVFGETEHSAELDSRRNVILEKLSNMHLTPIVMAKPFDDKDNPMIIDCVNKGTVSGETLAGGICGQSWTGSILMCTNYGYIINATRMWAGGIAGYVSTDLRLSADYPSVVSGCSNYADINESAYDPDMGDEGIGGWPGSYVGGIAGQVADSFDEDGNHAYVDFTRNFNDSGTEVCGRFGVGGIVGYLVNGVEQTDPDDPAKRECHVNELVNLGDVCGSDCVGGVAGACPGAVTDTANYGTIYLYPENKNYYCFAGGVAGELDSTGVCVSSYSIGRVMSVLGTDENSEITQFLGGVTGSAAYDPQVDGTFYCYETAPEVLGIVGTWYAEDNYGYNQLGEMGGDAAGVSMIQLFDGSTSLHKDTNWDTVDNVEIDGKTYYMTPQMEWCPISFEKLDEYHLAKSYPVSIYGSRVITNSPVYNGKDQQPEIKVMMGGVELTPDYYDVIPAREDGIDIREDGIDIREGAEASGIEGMTFVDAGDYSLEIVPKAESKKYDNSVMFIYKIKKASQKIKFVKPTKKTIKRGKTFKLKTKLSQGNGKVTYKKTKGDKKIKVTKAGTVEVGKKLKKGKKYKIKVKVSVASTQNYNATSTTKTITIKVK